MNFFIAAFVLFILYIFFLWVETWNYNTNSSNISKNYLFHTSLCLQVHVIEITKITSQNIKFFIKDFFSKCNQFRGDLQIFLNGQLHFLCSEYSKITLKYFEFPQVQEIQNLNWSMKNIFINLLIVFFHWNSKTKLVRVLFLDF